MKCDHEWRVFGTRAHEEVYPVFPDRGFIICTKCKKESFAERYKVIEKRPYDCPLFGKWGRDVIVEIIE